MNDQKNLTQNGLTTPNALLIFISIMMIGVCVYLTNHYFNTHFPSKLATGSGLCDISAFFNCDSATTSPASNIAGVPISFFGLIIGIFLLLGSIFPSDGMEKTNSVLVKLNLAGCVLLFLYSLIALGSLCPVCTGYYVLSAIAFFLFTKYSFARWEFDLKTFGIFAAMLIIGSGFVYNHFQDKKQRQLTINKQIINQFFVLNDLGDPTEESPYKIAKTDQSFSETPIRVSVFSDFQCPYCAKEAKQMNDLAKDYQGKIHIQYFFYPLDKACNKKVKGNFHDFACAAAYLAACSEEKFKSIHDEIFEKQESLSFEFIESLALKYDLKECYEKKEKSDFVIKSMEIANGFNIKSTPTLILNGKKIEGSLGNDQFKAIFDAILAK